jgi:hypothetical protein
MTELTTSLPAAAGPNWKRSLTPGNMVWLILTIFVLLLVVRLEVWEVSSKYSWNQPHATVRLKDCPNDACLLHGKLSFAKILFDSTPPTYQIELPSGEIKVFKEYSSISWPVPDQDSPAIAGGAMP